MSIQHQFSRVGQLLNRMGYAPPQRLQAPPELTPIQALARRVQAVRTPAAPAFAASQNQVRLPQSSSSVPAISLGFSGGTRLAEVSQGDATLETGDTGSGVKAVQRFLHQQGHPIVPSGYFDERTRTALVSFQEEQGIITDGVVGPQTLGFMKDPVIDSGLKDYKGRPIRGTEETIEGYKKLVEIAESRGYRVQTNSSYRTYNEQAKLWTQALRRYGSASAARQWVAPPGRSRHNHGRAIDLNVFKSNGRKIPDRELASMLDQAGLYRPMSWEPWHVEPKSTARSRGQEQYAQNDAPQSDDTMWT